MFSVLYLIIIFLVRSSSTSFAFLFGLCCLSVSKDGSSSRARTLWGSLPGLIQERHTYSNFFSCFCFLVGSISCIVWLLLFYQLGYRDYLQSPLQVECSHFRFICFVQIQTAILFHWLLGFVICLPLQPLMDNLEAQTYETFEKDTVKYIQVCSHSESQVCHGPGDWPLLENSYPR